METEEIVTFSVPKYVASIIIHIISHDITIPLIFFFFALRRNAIILSEDLMGHNKTLHVVRKVKLTELIFSAKRMKVGFLRKYFVCLTIFTH